MNRLKDRLFNRMSGRGVVALVGAAVAPSLSAMASARRHSTRNTTEAGDVSKQDSLGDRASSKLTLDDELIDILYAFGETEVFLGRSDAKGEYEVDEDGKPLTRQALLQRIRQKKEVIGKLRCQAWSMSRKRRTLKLAQKYLEQHESAVSNHLYMEELKKRIRILRRSFANFATYLIPWEGKIKRIESHFGSVVSSYFTFLRWIVFVNVIITLIIFSFVVVPETLADAAGDRGRQNRTASRKEMSSNERIHADELAVVWHYDGYLRYSPLFYGYYSDDPFLGQKVRYALPLAYFIVTLFIFAYSFFAILRKMAANARMSKLSGSKAEQYIYNWKVFTGWDYTIGNQDTASNTVMAVVIKLRESIAETRKRDKEKFICVQLFLRVVANLIIFAMLGFSVYCISFAVSSSQTAVEQDGNLFTKNQVPSVVATITHVFPMIFDLIGRMEKYHPRTALRFHLGRVLFLYACNYLTLIIALFEKMNSLREREEHSRGKRQLGGRNEQLKRPPPYASRNFNKEQFRKFAQKSTIRFDVTRTTRSVSNNTESPIVVTSAFGPVNVNNPNAVLRNGTRGRPFVVRPIGPAQLPIFTPPPRIQPPRPTSKVKQQYGGPDFVVPTFYTKPTSVPRVRTRPPWQRTTTPMSPNSGTVIQLDGENFINQTMSLPEPAERRSSQDDGFSSDICWETIIGQEIVKLVTMDLLVTILSILLIDFFRGLWIKYCSSWWCWDIETTFPEYGEFKVAENVLHIINNQGMIWLGLFFAPLLPALNNIKLIIIMYMRGWAVITCNVPAREIFRASRSSNFYLVILLLWLLLCTLPVGYVIASTKPSKSCGPFSQHDHFYTVVTQEIEKRVDATVLGYVKHVASPGVVIPILLFLMLIIYFLVSLVRGLREANTDLQQQLVHERTEEKKKIFELAGGGKKKDLERERERRKIHYIPLVEQKRREPWRVYHQDQEEARASDSSDSEEEDQEVESLVTIGRPPTQPMPSSTAETVHVLPFHPSLGSLVENEYEEEEETRVQVHRQSPGVSINSRPTTYSASDDQQSVVDVATPEEIRLVSSQMLRQPDVHRPSAGSSKDVREKNSATSTTRENEKNDGMPVDPQFQPWPSIDEVKQRKQELLKRTPLAFFGQRSDQPGSSKDAKADAPPVPQHRRAENENITSESEEDRRSGSPSRRFRISVSPSRKPMSSDDEGTLTSRRRYVIKQESTHSSVANVKAEDPKSNNGKNKTNPEESLSPRAPRVEFGEDDSPRVL